MQPGDVLVASITTPAWTSLFAMASGVVTDIGGPLSHSSIVAREYGIPAVLGTAVATRRIRSGQMIKVDGDAGTVRLLNGQESEEIESPTKSSPRRKIIAGAAGAAAAAGLTAWLVRRRSRVTDQQICDIPRSVGRSRCTWHACQVQRQLPRSVGC